MEALKDNQQVLEMRAKHFMDITEQAIEVA